MRRLRQGIVPILNTPFDEALELDLPSLRRATEQCVVDGVAGLVAPAVASEVHKLGFDERRRYLECVAETVAGRVPLIGGVSADEPADVRALTRHAVGAGCDAVLVQLPASLAGAGEERQRAFFLACAEEPAGALVIQDLDWGGGGMPTELLTRLAAEIPSFTWVKVETVPAGAKYSAVKDATGGGLQVMGGWGLPQMIEGLDRGVDAFTPTAVNRVFVHVDRLYRAGRREEAVALFERVVPVLAFACQHIDVSIHFLKRYCVRRGLFATAAVREPILAYDAHHRRYGDELTERLIALEDSLA